MSGRKTTWVANFHLSPEKGDPRAQLRRAVEFLEAGTHLRVFVEMPPILLGMSMSAEADLSWYRNDIAWQFEADAEHAVWAKEWKELADFLGGVK